MQFQICRLGRNEATPAVRMLTDSFISSLHCQSLEKQKVLGSCWENKIKLFPFRRSALKLLG